MVYSGQRFVRARVVLNSARGLRSVRVHGSVGAMGMIVSYRYAHGITACGARDVL